MRTIYFQNTITSFFPRITLKEIKVQEIPGKIPTLMDKKKERRKIVTL
jgi:hypothetical protein